MNILGITLGYQMPEERRAQAEPQPAETVREERIEQRTEQKTEEKTETKPAEGTP